MASEDIGLPKSTIQKMIKELLPADVRCANDTRDLVADCCVEFIQLLAAEAQEISEKEGKKTILADHIVKALEVLGFSHYTSDVTDVFDEFKLEVQKTHERGAKRRQTTASMSHEELLAEQQRLFASARSAWENEGSDASPSAMDASSSSSSMLAPSSSSSLSDGSQILSSGSISGFMPSSAGSTIMQQGSLSSFSADPVAEAAAAAAAAGVIPSFGPAFTSSSSMLPPSAPAASEYDDFDS